MGACCSRNTQTGGEVFVDVAPKQTGPATKKPKKKKDGKKGGGEGTEGKVIAPGGNNTKPKKKAGGATSTSSAHNTTPQPPINHAGDDIFGQTPLVPPSPPTALATTSPHASVQNLSIPSTEKKLGVSEDLSSLPDVRGPVKSSVDGEDRNNSVISTSLMDPTGALGKSSNESGTMNKTNQSLDLSMALDDIDIVTVTWTKTRYLGVAATNLFYDRVLSLRPGLRNTIFHNKDLAWISKDFFDMIDLLVGLLRDEAKFNNVLKPLGQRHLNYGATEDIYALFGDALQYTLKHALTSSYTPAVEHAWAATYERIVSTMMEASRGKVVAEPKPPAPKVVEPPPAPAPAPAKPTQPTNNKPQEKDIKVAQYLPPLPPNLEPVRASWIRLRRIGVGSTNLFFDRLFSQFPALRTQMFRPDNMEKQSKLLFDAFEDIVGKLHDESALEDTLKAIGERHKGFRVQASHFDAFEEAFCWNLQQWLKKEYTESMNVGWKGIFGKMRKYMI